MAVAPAWLPYAREEGLASDMLGGRAQRWPAVFLLVAGAVAWLGIGVAGAAAVAAVVLVGAGVLLFARARVGGFTGDVLGAAILLGETVGLLVAGAALVSTAVAKRLLGAAGGLVIDRLVGEPPAAVHPVAAFGDVMGRVEHTVYADTRRAGVGYTAAGLALGAGAGAVVGSTTAVVAVSAAGRMLRAQADEIRGHLEADDLERARAALPALVGRDPSRLDASGVAAAVVESVAENTVDAVVAPALWGAACGALGAAAYRAVNTMDAMVGNRSRRYERFGWGSARLDDLAAYVPARVTALLVGLARPQRWRAVRRVVTRDAKLASLPERRRRRGGVRRRARDRARWPAALRNTSRSRDRGSATDPDRPQVTSTARCSSPTMSSSCLPRPSCRVPRWRSPSRGDLVTACHEGATR